MWVGGWGGWGVCRINNPHLVVFVTSWKLRLHVKCNEIPAPSIHMYFKIKVLSVYQSMGSASVLNMNSYTCIIIWIFNKKPVLWLQDGSSEAAGRQQQEIQPDEGDDECLQCWGRLTTPAGVIFIKNVVAVAAYSRLASRSQEKFHTKKLSPLVRPCAAAPAQSTTSAYRSLRFSPR